MIYSIVETAKENGLDPFEYLKYLFETLPGLDRKSQQALDTILPWSESLPHTCKVTSRTKPTER